MLYMYATPSKVRLKSELYLFLAGLLQQFNFSSSDKGLPDINDATIGITRVPKPYYVKIVARTL